MSSMFGIVLIVFRHFHDSFRESYIKPYKASLPQHIPCYYLGSKKYVKYATSSSRYRRLQSSPYTMKLAINFHRLRVKYDTRFYLGL